jgi:integrase
MSNNKLTIESINQELKAAKIRIRICTVKEGNTLFLRGTLPPKPGSGKVGAYQQRVSLGVFASEVGLQFAKGEAIRLAGLLDTYRFSWESYLPDIFNDSTSQLKKCGEWIKLFEEDFWQTGTRCRVTWKDYRKVFKKLPANELLVYDLAKKIILDTKPNTKSRERTTDKIASLCEFAEIPDASNLRRYRGCYSQRGKDTPIVVPAYQEILDCVDHFHNDWWRNAFCLQAAYGLRNHEIYHLNFDKMHQGLLIVNKNTKTGWRVVPSCHPEWVEKWGLKKLTPADMPQSTLTDNDLLGRQVWKAYKRSKVPFSPYALRHRFACDCALQNKPVALAAKVMGHSLETHTKIYHAFLSQDDLLSAWYK